MHTSYLNSNLCQDPKDGLGGGRYFLSNVTTRNKSPFSMFLASTCLFNWLMGDGREHNFLGLPNHTI